jgi:molybdopterin-containing oxidoreductase family membrane subunit
MGFFVFLLFMFIKVLPIINIFEMRDLLLKNHHQFGHGHDDHENAEEAH